MLTSLSKNLHVFTGVPEPEPQILPSRNELEEIERGRRLRETKHTPGWEDSLDLLQRQVDRAEFALMNYNGSNKDELYRKQCRARAMREMFQEYQIEVMNAVNAAEDAMSQVRVEAPASIGTAY